MRNRSKNAVRIVRNHRYSTWNAIWRDDSGSHSQKLGDFSSLPTKLDAINRALELGMQVGQSSRPIPTVNNLVDGYRRERMPEKFSTRYSMNQWIINHIVPQWGKNLITDVQAREVELWLRTLPLTPKSQVHIRSILSQLWDYAMWSAAVPKQRNPMELVVIKGGSKRQRKPHVLTENEFRRFHAHLPEPFATIAVVCLAFGLRISECLGLKWSDVDWSGSLMIQRGIVRQRVGAVKTEDSQERLPADSRILDLLSTWRSRTIFTSDPDWMFASTVKLGRLPVSYPGVMKAFTKAAAEAGLKHFGTHTLRHTYRSWLSAEGASLDVQRRLMRHSDIRTTMNIYGNPALDEMKGSQSRIAGRVVN